MISLRVRDYKVPKCVWIVFTKRFENPIPFENSNFIRRNDNNVDSMTHKPRQDVRCFSFYVLARYPIDSHTRTCRHVNTETVNIPPIFPGKTTRTMSCFHSKTKTETIRPWPNRNRESLKRELVSYRKFGIKYVSEHYGRFAAGFHGWLRVERNNTGDSQTDCVRVQCLR